jgi:ABC-type multidrug transport system ATPase subunit
MRNLILHLSRHLKKTVVVSSHLLNEIEQIATRMLIIDKGKKIVEGTVDELFDPAKTIVEIEVLDAKAAAEKIKQSNWAGHLEEVKANSLLLQLHKNQVPFFNRDLVNMKIDVMSLRPGNSLEKYFLSLTGTNQHVAAFTN